ncbi:CGNR zinc finger domain-containing protein [Micromonospora sp. 067-2]|uniref:CGNR zinc finger domain-containing protein n=1 Tax=Micromonospora sp. 067-2 TaxID=2789270 RepID=UPI00397CF834
MTPEATTAIVNLLNSRPLSFSSERLDDATTAREVLRPFGQDDGPPSAQLLRQVRAIRDELVALAGEPASTERWANLTDRLSTSTFRYDFSGPRDVRPHQMTGDPVVAAIAQAVAELVAEGRWSRVKLCANDSCRSAFYDETRSRTQRWHSYDVCGNRVNVAAHRARATGVT